MTPSKKFHSALIPDSRLLQGLLGLRGIAACAVVLCHICLFTGIKVPAGFNFIERDFGYGAQLFFVLSAFSLMYSTEHTMHRQDWVREYLIKRFFRITPLFYLVLAFMIAAKSINSELPSIVNILLNAFFVFGFFPDSKFGLVWGGWTIGVEMIFYVLFPVLLVVIKTKKQALIFLMIALIISYVARVELHTQYFNVVANPHPKLDWNYYSFVPNLYFFAVGIYAYRIKQELVNASKVFWIVIRLVAMMTLGILLLSEVGRLLENSGRLDLIVWAFGFGALCVWQSAKPSFWSANRYFEYLGERSYSIYLLHPVIIYFSKSYIESLYMSFQYSIGAYAYFICAVFVLIIVLAISEITYRVIEIPGIRLGREIIRDLCTRENSATNLL
jgi:peptidoglycan/LPS O-acetylase OafA/YrhL